MEGSPLLGMVGWTEPTSTCKGTLVAMGQKLERVPKHRIQGRRSWPAAHWLAAEGWVRTLLAYFILA